jgi:hypothetical protein
MTARGQLTKRGQLWKRRAQVLVQLDARPFTHPVSRAGIGEASDKRFGIGAEIPESLDRIRESPACGRIFIQECLSFGHGCSCLHVIRHGGSEISGD